MDVHVSQNQESKSVIFRAVKMNWSCHTSDDWQSTEFTVYDDCSIKITIDNGGNIKSIPPDGPLFTGDRRTQLLKAIGEFANYSMKEPIRAFDGTGWHMTAFQDGAVINEYKGYIYGDALLERLENLLPHELEQLIISPFSF